MDVLYLLVPLSVVLVFLIGAVLWLALHGGQFDDLESPGMRILADDDSAEKPEGPGLIYVNLPRRGGAYDGGFAPERRGEVHADGARDL